MESLMPTPTSSSNWYNLITASPLSQGWLIAFLIVSFCVLITLFGKYQSRAPRNGGTEERGALSLWPGPTDCCQHSGWFAESFLLWSSLGLALSPERAGIFCALFGVSSCMHGGSVLQAYLWDIVGSAPDRHNKANTAIQQDTCIFWFPSTCESCLQYTVVCYVCNSIRSSEQGTYLN